jgi:hypothetical protein
MIQIIAGPGSVIIVKVNTRTVHETGLVHTMRDPTTIPSSPQWVREAMVTVVKDGQNSVKK